MPALEIATSKEPQASKPTCWLPRAPPAFPCCTKPPGKLKDRLRLAKPLRSSLQELVFADSADQFRSQK
eukprot:1157575-Pelagomonas_calceolata.AAC.2